MSGVYVHLPFCRLRCVYCDFYAVGERLAPWHDYVSALIAEARARVPLMYSSPRTLYFGGGTPSLMPGAEFARLADAILLLSGGVDEFTVEVNPDDVTADMVDLWRDCGVNRVSMGVQSLVDAELRAICRRHDSVVARRAFDFLRKRFDNISLDLMFGLPGQSPESFRQSVEGVLDMRPEHISAYSLMYEERTALTRMRDAGTIVETDEEDYAAMFSFLCDSLGSAGYEQYEVSNYARPGFRSIHNSSYWDASEYVGLGAAAHSYDGNRLRLANLPDFKSYIAYWLRGEGLCPVERESLGDEELREEMIMTRMRTREGLSLSDYSGRFGESALRELLAAAQPSVRARQLSRTGDRLALTRDGVMVSDKVIVSLF